MSKTPYELRFDLLMMAKDMLDRQYEMQKEFAWESFKLAHESSLNVGDKMYEEWQKYCPKAMSPEEIISQAEKLQGFVNKKD